MATYKVIQDIEAEDKLLGPLTLKQFIFAAVAIGFGVAAFFVASKTSIFAVIPFLPFILVPAILAAPLGRDQPTDVWLAAQIRFFLKPRKRIWDQSGLKELVTITAPKKLEHTYSDGLSQQEVRSRLQALADTIDSRGWAVKNVNVSLYAAPAYATTTASSDRLVNPASLPQSVPDAFVHAEDDILDAANNPVAQQLDALMRRSGQAQKSAAIERMQQAIKKSATHKNDYSFLDQQSLPADQAMFGADEIVAPGSNHNEATYLDTTENDEEKALLKKIKQDKAKAKQNRNPHHKTIKTPQELAEEAREHAKQAQQPKEVTPPKNPVNIELAKHNDLSVATLAGLAKNKANQSEGEIRIQH